ncbi:MAG: hypothetical protein MJE63_00190 [Proteobacteria bacterium]|nr:hypothetical protein [Pseudomonadota bacterium]
MAEEENSNLEKMLKESSEETAATIAKKQFKEKQTLQYKRMVKMLPFQIFLLVADADGKIDPKEVAQFKEFLSRREKHCSNQYTRRMYHSTVINYSALTNRFQGGHIKKDYNVVKNAMDYVAMCVNPKVMLAICDDLKDLAVAIAEASGGFMGVTSPVSKEEKEVIKSLEGIFAEASTKASEIEVPDQFSFEF